MKLCALGLLMSLALACIAWEAPAQDPGSLRPAGDFTLLSVEGDSLQFSSLRGRVVLLNLWATWCKPCLEEMPDLNTLHKDLSPKGLTVVGLAVDGEDQTTVDRFVARLGVTYPVVYGSVEAAQAVLGGNAVPILPTTLLIDQDGFITDRIVGKVPLAETTWSIEALLRR